MPLYMDTHRKVKGVTAKAVAEAHGRAQAQVQAAKKDIEGDRLAAQSGLEAEVAALAQEIVRRVLAPAAAGR